MREQSTKIAVCAMMAAQCVVLMVLGAALGIGMYLAPMLAGACLVPVGKKWGTRYQLMLWAAISLLCLMLVSDVEENLMFLGFFGWYPALRPVLERVRKGLRLALKVLIFNGAVVSLEALIMLVLVPEDTGWILPVILLLVGNLTFLLYDAAFLPSFERTAARYLKKLFPRF